MLAPARRAALSSSKSAAAGSPRTVRRLILAEQAVTTTTTTTTPVCAKYAHAARRHFHASPSTSFFKAAWIPMRVKVPWVDALAQSQQEQTTSKGKEDIEETVKPDLTPRKMSDSYFSAVLPLAEDKWLLDSYLNASGRIRLGTLFMDLDALAGIIAYRHTDDTVATVTAAVN